MKNVEAAPRQAGTPEFRCWTLKLANAWPTLVIASFWIGNGLVMVHKTLPVRLEVETGGWECPLMMAMLVVPQIITAYFWGRSDASNSDLASRGTGN